MVLDFIEKYKLAILGTVMFHVAFFIYTNFATIQRPYVLVEPNTEMLIPLDDIPLDPEMIKLLELKQNNLQPQSEEIYNVTSDANDTRDKSYDDYSTQEVTVKDAEYYKNLENEYMSDAKQTNSGLIKKEESSFDIKKDDDKKITNNNNPDNTVDSDGNKAFAGDVMASFSLEGRKVHSLDKPGYTCNSSGTVVLQIKVNGDGSMNSVTYQPSGSINATDCMIQQSIKYAKRSRFNYSSTAPAPQTGTITYKFVSR